MNPLLASFGVSAQPPLRDENAEGVRRQALLGMMHENGQVRPVERGFWHRVDEATRQSMLRQMFVDPFIGDVQLTRDAMNGAPGVFDGNGRPTQATIERATDVALDLGAGGLAVSPLKPRGSIGTFGGRNAKTAGREKLAQAEAMEGAESLASRNRILYDPPVPFGRDGKPIPPRTFDEDYSDALRADPGLATTDGRLLKDLEGRELRAKTVVGRRVVGGDDEAFPTEELHALGTTLTGQEPKGSKGGDAGLYSKRPGSRLDSPDDRKLSKLDGEDGWIRQIWVREDLQPENAIRVLAHEIAHGIQDRVGPNTVYKRSPDGHGVPFRAIPDDGIKKELARVYHDLNSQDDWRRGYVTKPSLQGKPEDFGYRGDEIRSEHIAEAIRAYMTDPSYFKRVAPKTAAVIREHANNHPWLSKHVQFNANGSPLTTVLGLQPDEAQAVPQN